MATIVVNGTFFNCNGVCCCGGTDFKSKEQIIKSFHCEFCSSYQKDGLKIIIKHGKQKTLGEVV